MRLKFTVVTARSERHDVLVTADVTATVEDVAKRLSEIPGVLRPEHADAALSLRVSYPGRARARLLSPATALGESSLRSGCVVELVRAGEARPGDARDADVAGLVRVLSGPDAGREFTVQRGVNVIGRDRSATVPLTDREVSRRHASLTIAEAATVSDLNSANGMLVEGASAKRAVVSSGSRIRVGDSILAIDLLPHTRETVDAEPGEFSRSPRVETVYQGLTVALPQLPAPVERSRLPLLVLLSPLLLGAALYAITSQPLTLVFVVLSPIVMLATWLDNRIQGRRKQRAARRDFDEGMRRSREELTAERTEQIAARCSESPGSAEVLDAIRSRSTLLWTRKPEHSTFLELRLGLGAQPSRSRVGMPNRTAGAADDWSALCRLAEEFAEIGPVPVVESFARAGAIAVAGTGPAAHEAANALVLQLAGLHSPADLVITALASPEAIEDWAWLKWLPHVDSPHSPLRASGLTSGFDDGIALVSELEGVVERRRAASGGHPVIRSHLAGSVSLDERHGTPVDRLPVVPAILVIVTAGSVVDHARVVSLAEDGADVGVFVLWQAPAISSLPVACRTFLAIDAGTARARVGLVRNGRDIPLDEVERVDPIAAETAARCLAPAVDRGSPVLDETDLPRTASFLDLYDVAIASDARAVSRRWAKNDSLTAGWRAGVTREPSGLGAVVGQGPEGPFVLDLRKDGPHALVGGTTGSGKSEFLQSWIMGMAAEYAPDRVTFLLVDYKGGAAFAECVDLPHTVGLVTDLTPQLVRRALTSLRAELRHREALLAEKGAKDLETLEARGDRDAPPALVIVIDEFAALAGEVPEFVDGVVDIAQRGRSLGLHLIMATQRPSGVIKDSLRANTNLRVTLRMADAPDSVDVIGVPDAARFDPGVPGRAAAKLGGSRVLDFQTAYLGSCSGQTGSESEVEVRWLPFGPAGTAALSPSRARPSDAPRDLERLVDTIARAADAEGVAVPRRPWLEPLPPVIDLATIHSRDPAPALGIADEPSIQRQLPFTLDLDSVGNLACFGAGGTGKSAFLRSVAAAWSADALRDPVTIHAIDCAGSGLAPLESLPTVSSVLPGSDTERVGRLISLLADLIARRSSAFAAAHAASLAEYRRAADEPTPRVLVLLDGFGAFRAEYEFGDSGALFTRLQAIASAGRQVGVHVIVTADRPSALPAATSAVFGARVVLRLADEGDYATIGLAPDMLLDAPSGRGMCSGTEIQLAVPGGSTDLAEQTRAIDELAARLRAAGMGEEPAVPRLPSAIPLSSLPGTVDGMPVLGVSAETLEAIGFPADGLFVVTGPFGSGRTTAVRTALRSALAADPRRDPYLIAALATELGDAAAWADSAAGPEEAEALARRLLGDIVAGPGGDRRPLLVIENVGDFEGSSAEAAVATLVKAARRSGVPVIAEAETVTAPGAWQLFGELKAGRTGIALQPDDGDGGALFRTAFPGARRADFPPGRGYLVRSGRTSRIQVALPE